MTIDLYINFEKRKNSTKRPVEGGIVNKHTYTGYLRSPSNVMNPVIELQNLQVQNVPCVYTYAWIPSFYRYYFVKDWVWENSLWVVYLEVDVLATYKPHIGETTEYVLRADTTTDFNTDITDIMYPATNDYSIQKIAMQNNFVQTLSQGTYIVGIINKASTDAVGAITYYAMSSSEFGTFKDKLFSDDALKAMNILDQNGNLAINDCSEELFKTIYNPYQYIASCMWFPISKNDIPGTAVGQIPLGWWSFNGLTGKLISDQTDLIYDGVTAVPEHPQATRGQYLNYAPYTKISLYGKFGIIPIDPTYLKEGRYLKNIYYVDFITGECVLEVWVTDGVSAGTIVPVAKTTFMLGVPIQIAQVGVDYLGTAVSAIDTVKNIVPSATMGFISGGVAGAIGGGLIAGASGIYNTLQSAMPQLQTSGSNGSFNVVNFSTIIVVTHYKIAEENITHKGRPVCSNKTLNTLSGFIQCAEGDVDISCFDEERMRISTLLRSGFFWE